MSAPMTVVGKCTIYRCSEFMGNIYKTEATEARFGRGSYAQYASAAKVEFRKPRQRNWRGYAEGYKPSTVILEGWGHPEPDDMFPKAELAEGQEAIGVMSRYSSHDEGWARDFDGMLKAYLAANPNVKVLVDYRGINTYDRLEPNPPSTRVHSINECEESSVCPQHRDGAT